ncbi:MAG TPA: 23S rRNA (uracil(1939)-C(5))-methyltransferase RlmD [bacterium]|nr:23S rRNA (uracil(1939)-C(5))-methyltransferase RlmD [bacterium]
MKTHTLKPVQTGDIIEVEIQSLAFGGDSVSRYEGFALFIRGGLPGERVKVKITQVKDHYATGEIVEIARFSPDRVAPPCPIFEECGGCQWQHLNYPKQLQTKRQFVVDALSRIGKMDSVTVEPCLPSEASYGYRNKAMPVLSMREGRFISGIYEPRSHKLVPYQHCPIQGDAINSLIQKVLKKIDLAGLTPYQEKKHDGFLRHLAIRQGFGTGELLLAFVTRDQHPEGRVHKTTLLPEPLEGILPRLAQELMAETPGLVGVLQNINPSRTNIVFGPTTQTLAGRDHYFEKFDGLTLKVSLKSFLQVNTAQAQVLHTVVREALGAPEGRKKWGTVLDLYSGIGTLALAVADRADYVVGAEEVAPAVEDARENAALNHKDNLDFLEGDVADLLLKLKAQGLQKIDAAILDPPRKGVLPEVLSRLIALGPQRLVYVSCDPTTLARDLALLAKQGYQVDWAQPLDMFPQTYHVETIVRLTRTAPPAPEPLPAADAKLPEEPFRLPKLPKVSLNALGGAFWAWGAALGSLLAKPKSFQWPLAVEEEGPAAGENPAAQQAAVELPGQELLVESPLEAPPAEPRIPWKNLLAHGTPRFPWNPRTAGLSLLALFVLAGGGYWAVADLAPLVGRSPFQVNTIPQFIPDTIAIMPTRNFLRYEMVPFEVRIHPEDMPHFSSMHAVVEVFHDGQPVPMVDGKTRLYLKKDPANARFIGNWPIPYNPVPGTYTAQIALTGPQWPDPKEFESAFTISPLRPSGLFPGYSALTMEGGKHLFNGVVPPVDGRGNSSLANAMGWAKFMGANTYCFLAGQTSVWDKLNPKDFPFNRGDLELAHRYAAAAHDQGLKFAAYMTTFRVVGDGWQQAQDHYHFTMGYDRESDQVVPTDFISLEDSARRQDILSLLKELDKDPNIDMIGLDYVRTGTGGYEFVDEFVRDLNVPGPADYWSMTKEERIHWLARTVELKENKDVTALFEWWRAHKVAMTLKSILDEAKLSKPVFTFTLGWDMGHQHGQDPAMFEDAGVNYNHIMLYQSDRKTLDQMNQQWPDYISRSNGMYALGEMVDENWVQNSLSPPGPEELYDREVATFQAWQPVNAGIGMFWHDLYRLIYGQKGPYSAMEWAIAGGKAFSLLQRTEGTLPLEVELIIPKEAPAGVPIPVSVEIHNHSINALSGIVLHQIDASKDYDQDLATVGPFDIPAGDLVRVKDLTLTLPKDNHPERDNRFMAAVVAEKPGQPLRAFDFAYVKALPPGSPDKPTDMPKSDDVKPANE